VLVVAICAADWRCGWCGARSRGRSAAVPSASRTRVARLGDAVGQPGVSRDTPEHTNRPETIWLTARFGQHSRAATRASPTFNPKVAGSIPARPIQALGVERKRLKHAGQVCQRGQVCTNGAPPMCPPGIDAPSGRSGGNLARVDDDELTRRELRVLDPDWDSVPPDLAEQHMRPVNVSYWDDDLCEEVSERATLVVVPQLHAWARRIEDDGLAYWDDDDG